MGSLGAKAATKRGNEDCTRFILRFESTRASDRSHSGEAGCCGPGYRTIDELPGVLLEFACLSGPRRINKKLGLSRGKSNSVSLMNCQESEPRRAQWSKRKNNPLFEHWHHVRRLCCKVLASLGYLTLPSPALLLHPSWALLLSAGCMDQPGSSAGGFVSSHGRETCRQASAGCYRRVCGKIMFHRDDSPPALCCLVTPRTTLHSRDEEKQARRSVLDATDGWHACSTTQRSNDGPCRTMLSRPSYVCWQLCLVHPAGGFQHLSEPWLRVSSSAEAERLPRHRVSFQLLECTIQILPSLHIPNRWHNVRSGSCVAFSVQFPTWEAASMPIWRIDLVE